MNDYISYPCDANYLNKNISWILGRLSSNSDRSTVLFSPIFIIAILFETIVYLLKKFTVLFSHMTSVQSAFISPITRVIKLKHYLWFAHTSNGILLKVSRLLTNGIITSTRGSCPLKGSKVYPIGQSINSQKFKKKNSKAQSVKNLVHGQRIGTGFGKLTNDLTINLTQEFDRNFRLGQKSDQ